MTDDTRVPTLNSRLLNDDKPFVQWFRRPWQERLAFVHDMVREISEQTDPQKMVEVYGQRMTEVLPSHGFVSLSCRDLEYPYVRITRTGRAPSSVNPWKQRDQLPVVKGGVFAELIYGEKGRILEDLDLPDDDPAKPHLTGMKSLCALPLFDQGKALNMVIMARNDNGFSDEFIPEQLWLSNLFGRATANLVLKQELQEAYERVDRELKVVADIQRSLLPTQLPEIPGLDIGSYYQTAKNAGGDYYDFFPLPGGKLGMLIADVSGHGTPAAVVMAVTHSIAHTHDGEPDPPSKLLNFINKHLAARYTNGTGTFVTAFYGIYDPATRELRFANAGHNPPRLKRGKGGPNGIVEGAANLPLGIDEDEIYVDDVQTLQPGDILVLYTDGITEARSPDGELFGTDRLDQVIADSEQSSQELIDETLIRVERFANYAPPTDDRTMVVIQVS
jgi:phosphoserine phosphatase RsbU/P